MCEFAYQDSRFQFLLCKKLAKDGLDSSEKAAKSMCIFQKYCALERRYKTTDSSSNCSIKQQRGD